LGTVHRYLPLHVRECTLLLHVLAVQCATVWNRCRCYGSIMEHYKALWEHYGAIMEAIWDVTEHYKAVTECCGALENVTEHYGTLLTL